jgi:hypothetical protein
MSGKPCKENESEREVCLKGEDSTKMQSWKFEPVTGRLPATKKIKLENWDTVELPN